MKNLKNIFLHTDYRNAIRQKLAELKHSIGSAYTTQALADECMIQRSYLSKVLNGSTHLNEDQLFSAIQYLKFSQAEMLYLETLHQWQRASNKKRKEQLQNKLNTLQANALKADVHLTTRKLDSNNEDLFYLKYYLNPQVQLSHVFLSIEFYQKNPEKVRKMLQLSKDEWSKILATLFELNLVRKEDEKLIAEQIQIFLSSESPVFPVYHHLVKTFSLPQIQKIPAQDKNALSVMFTCGPETWNRIRARLVEMTKEIEQLVINDQNPENVYQLSLDLFPWSRALRSQQ